MQPGHGSAPQQPLTRHRQQTTTCPRQPGLAPGLWHPPQGPGRATRLGWPGAQPLAREQPRGDRRVAPAPRGAKARPRRRCHPPWPWGPGAVTALGWGPGELCCWKGSHRQLLPVKESPAWLGGCHRQPGFCPSSQGRPCLAISLDLHPSLHPGSPQGGQCPLDTPEGHFPAAGRNIWSQRCHQGANRALPAPKTGVGMDPGHLLQPERCKQAPGNPAVPGAPKHGSPKPAQEMETAPCHARTVTEVSGRDPAGIYEG